MGQIFGNTGVAMRMPSADAKRAYTVLKIGSEIVDFTMIEESRGSQSSRLQIDATLDGGLYVVGTTTGIGTYTAVFFDGPVCSEGSKESVMKKYLSLKNVSDRVASVFFYPSVGAEESTKGSSEYSARFTGILGDMGVSLVDVDGLLYLRVALSIVGSWKDK